MSDVGSQMTDFYYVYNKYIFWNQIHLLYSTFAAPVSLFGSCTIQQINFVYHFHSKIKKYQTFNGLKKSLCFFESR